MFIACGALKNAAYFYNEFNWEDHISVPLFEVNGDELIGSSITFKISPEGLQTWRLHLPYLSKGHYIHFVYNEESALKDLLRKLITSHSKGRITFSKLILECLRSVKGLCRGEYPNLDKTYKIVLDFEGGIGKACSKSKTFSFDLDDEFTGYVEKVKREISAILQLHHHDFRELPFTMEKMEDVYHPFNINPPKDFDEYIVRSNRCYRIDTGLLSSCGSTNPTGVLFPLIQKLIKYESNR